MSLSFLASGTGPFVGQDHALPAAFEPGGATHEGARACRELESYSPITLAGHGPAPQVPLVSMLGKLSGIARRVAPNRASSSDAFEPFEDLLHHFQRLWEWRLGQFAQFQQEWIL